MGKKKEMLQIFSDREVFYELIAALSLALDMDARGKLYHAWRVALAARETSRFFFPQGEVDVFFAGLLHDIGAMGLDDHIVHQMISGPDLANPIIQKHSEKGAQITGELPAFEKASLYILDHHENWDGTGFPLGKKGQEISKGGQIVAVADQFDILLRVHHYRADKALKQLQERSGRSLAAEAVEAFTVAMEEMGDFEALLHNESLGPLMAQAMKELPEVNCTHPNPIQASVHIFAKIIDAKHAYTAGHSQRVARYSVALGQELGLIEEELSELEVAGLLHDFGKISVPGSILDKPARLSSKEFAIIKKHPGRTAELLEIVQGLSKLAWVAGGHHERFDGAGYPLGLKKEQIPLGAKILAVSDAFDAMTSRRPYQQNRSPLEAWRVIQKNAGSQFDPEVAAVAGVLVDCYEKTLAPRITSKAVTMKMR